MPLNYNFVPMGMFKLIPGSFLLFFEPHHLICCYIHYQESGFWGNDWILAKKVHRALEAKAFGDKPQIPAVLFPCLLSFLGNVMAGEIAGGAAFSKAALSNVFETLRFSTGQAANTLLHFGCHLAEK